MSATKAEQIAFVLEILGNGGALSVIAGDKWCCRLVGVASDASVTRMEKRNVRKYVFNELKATRFIEKFAEEVLLDGTHDNIYRLRVSALTWIKYEDRSLRPAYSTEFADADGDAITAVVYRPRRQPDRWHISVYPTETPTDTIEFTEDHAGGWDTFEAAQIYVEDAEWMRGSSMTAAELHATVVE